MENPYVKIRNTPSLLFTLKPGVSSALRLVLRVQFFLQIRCDGVHHWCWLGQRTLASVPWAGLSLLQEPPWVRAQVLPLIVLIYETLISRSPYCQYWLLQLQTLHLHSSMKGKRRERSLLKRCVEMSRGHFPEVCTALQTMSHGPQFSLMTLSSYRAS